MKSLAWITVPMAQFGTHGCGYDAVRRSDGSVYFSGDCVTCGPDGPLWSGAAHAALEQLASNPELWNEYAATGE